MKLEIEHKSLTYDKIRIFFMLVRRLWVRVSILSPIFTTLGQTNVADLTLPDTTAEHKYTIKVLFTWRNPLPSLWQYKTILPKCCCSFTVYPRRSSGRKIRLGGKKRINLWAHWSTNKMPEKQNNTGFNVSLTLQSPLQMGGEQLDKSLPVTQQRWRLRNPGNLNRSSTN